MRIVCERHLNFEAVIYKRAECMQKGLRVGCNNRDDEDYLSKGTVAGLQQGLVWGVDAVHAGNIVVEDQNRMVTVGLLL